MKIIMDLSLKNEDRVSGSEDCEVFMKDIVRNKIVKSKYTPNVQTKTSRNLKL